MSQPWSETSEIVNQKILLGRLSQVFCHSDGKLTHQAMLPLVIFIAPSLTLPSLPNLPIYPLHSRIIIRRTPHSLKFFSEYFLHLLVAQSSGVRFLPLLPSSYLGPGGRQGFPLAFLWCSQKLCSSHFHSPPALLKPKPRDFTTDSSFYTVYLPPPHTLVY